MMRIRMPIQLAAMLLFASILSGCGGGGNTYNPDLIGAPAADFLLAAAPGSRTVTQGQSTTYTVTLTAENGFSAAVTPTVTGLPGGATASFSAAPVTPTAAGAATTLTVNTTVAGGAAVATPTGTYTLRISTTGGDLAKQTTVTLNVTAPAGPGSLSGQIE